MLATTTAFLASTSSPSSRFPSSHLMRQSVTGLFPKLQLQILLGDVASSCCLATSWPCCARSRSVLQIDAVHLDGDTRGKHVFHLVTFSPRRRYGGDSHSHQQHEIRGLTVVDRGAEARKRKSENKYAKSSPPPRGLRAGIRLIFACSVLAEFYQIVACA